jgi:hypothetical protein
MRFRYSIPLLNSVDQSSSAIHLLYSFAKSHQEMRPPASRAPGRCGTLAPESRKGKRV